MIVFTCVILEIPNVGLMIEGRAKDIDSSATKEELEYVEKLAASMKTCGGVEPIISREFRHDL